MVAGKLPLKLTGKQLAHCRNKIVRFIRAEVKAAKASGAVVAMSGGVDSSLVAVLGKEALGDSLRALILPEEGTSDPQDARDAQELAEKLGIGYDVINIAPAVKSIDGLFPWSRYHGADERTARGNVKPRVRMILNYLAANLENKLVLGTGNKTELMLGYFTKFGDGGVDLLPIGGLYKTQVRQLAAFVGLPEKIVQKVPTAGLWKGQSDESELGATYEEMDAILYNIVDKKMNAKIAAKKLHVEVELVNRLLARMKQNEHKLRMPRVAKLGLR